ncbi:DNA mismatch repair endonuclease MutL [candidate division FCPU426 bacterium]|nr:DNA mismatch repair endonuclease MutL [candidate division FCPU426 bacterium]
MAPGKIKILPEQVANLIAAGEVVERPAAVVKELVENSLDAGAKAIEVEIRAAGLKYIRVTDDGMGMIPEDAQLAFARHATSKVLEAEDLESIATLGFRGEALPSLAAVSRLELTTKTMEATAGFRLLLEAGKVKLARATGCAAGTTIIVEDLFFNTPARRKFMKTPATEQMRAVQEVEWAALAHPGVRFRLLADKRELFNCPPAAALPDRLAALYGRSLPKDLMPLEQEAGGVRLYGLIAGPGENRHSRQHTRFFINRRPVEHRGLIHAVLQAYRHLIPAGRFPVCYLFLEMPLHLVDVNVHPAKKEVRLRDEHGIHHLVQTAVTAALQGSDLAGGKERLFRQLAGNDAALPSFRLHPSAAWSANRVQESMAQYLTRQEKRVEPRIPDVNTQAGDEFISPAPERIIGQVGRAYIAAQDEEGFFLVDQHAAHERILYESFLNRPSPIPRQQLLLPITFELTPAQSTWLKSNLGCFGDLGLEISSLGGNTFALQTQPESVARVDFAALILEIIEWGIEQGARMDQKILRERTVKSMACRAAVKAGERLQPETMLALVNQIGALAGLPTCPHGRPFLFRLSWKELDKIFKRDYAG